MPFKSKAQMRKFFAMESKGEIPKGTTRQWLEPYRRRQGPAGKSRKSSGRKTGVCTHGVVRADARKTTEFDENRTSTGGKECCRAAVFGFPQQ